MTIMDIVNIIMFFTSAFTFYEWMNLQKMDYTNEYKDKDESYGS